MTLLILLVLLLLAVATLVGIVLELAAWLFVVFLVVAATAAFLIWRWFTNAIARLERRVGGDEATSP